MDRITPILSELRQEVVFPFRDVPANGWAILPKKSSLDISFHFSDSRELYDAALMIGSIGPALLYAYLYERQKGPCIVYALTQFGWASPGLPMYMWQPLISYQGQTLSSEEYQRIYDSRGWVPWLDSNDHQMADNPLPCKWVRLGIRGNEDRFITHEPAPDNIIFFPVRQASDRSVILKRLHKRIVDWKEAYTAVKTGK